jgi:hypothetical protein
MQETTKATTATQPGAPTRTEKPALTAEAIKSIVLDNRPVSDKDNAEKYVERLKRTLPKDYGGITEDHYKAIKLLAESTYFKKSKEEDKPVAKAKEGPVPLTEQQELRIDAAMQAAVDAADGRGMIDNDAQVALGDAITHAIGGSNPTHSRGGGHKGSFNKDVTIQQALSNIGKILQEKTQASINLHLQKKWSSYNV